MKQVDKGKDVKLHSAQEVREKSREYKAEWWVQLNFFKYIFFTLCPFALLWSWCTLLGSIGSWFVFNCKWLYMICLKQLNREQNAITVSNWVYSITILWHFLFKLCKYFLYNFKGSEVQSVLRSAPSPQLSNFLIIFVSCWPAATVGVPLKCVRARVCGYVCIPSCLPVKQRACPSEVLLFSPVLLSPAVCLPPPAGRPRLPHADLFNCLPVPGPTGECVCVVLLCQGGQGRQHPRTHTQRRRQDAHEE